MAISVSVMVFWSLKKIVNLAKKVFDKPDGGGSIVHLVLQNLN